jgi:hypothetical protein
MVNLPCDSFPVIICIIRHCSRPVAVFDCFHAPALQNPAHSPLRPGVSSADGHIERRCSAFDNYAGEIPQNDLNSTYLIDAATWPIHIPDADRYSFDGLCEFPQFRSEFSTDLFSFSLAEIGSQDSDVSGNRGCGTTARLPLDRFR